MNNSKLIHLFVLFLFAFSVSACSIAGASGSTTIDSSPMVRTTNSQTSPSNSTSSAALTGLPESGERDDFSSDPQQVSGTYSFAEGPAVDAAGNVIFSDINAGKLFRWSTDGSVTVFAEGLNHPNGLMFDPNGNLIVCEGGNGRLISIDQQGRSSALVESYNGIQFNEPNDLWIDRYGGIYFSDPAYTAELKQDGEHVYYLSPNRAFVTRVISDLTRPNGLVGTADGTTLYVADHGAGLTFSYTIERDGTLSNKKLFAPIGSDGMDLDAARNLYLTTSKAIQVYDASGAKLGSISLPEDPTNLVFDGADGKTLFVTARTAVYTIPFSAAGSEPSGSAPAVNVFATLPTGTFTLTSPDLPSDGRLPAEYTCDGSASTLALNWSSAPLGTTAYAVIMHHTPEQEESHWYWVLYNIPADVTSLSKNSSNIGNLGTNSVNGRLEYAPPCSKGPGDKEYFYTLYALSSQPQLDVSSEKVDRAALLRAMESITLASAELKVVYARP